MDELKKAYEVCCGGGVHPSIMSRDEKVKLREDAVNKINDNLGFIPRVNVVKNTGPVVHTIDKWDTRFIELARHIASWSKDPSTQCGAVIVDDKQRIVSVGYNGFPRDVEDTDSRLVDRELKYELTVHAEMNAILFANRSLEGCTIYVHPMMPCTRCAVTIIQAGISTVVAPALTPDLELRWGDSVKRSKAIFKEANVLWKEI